MSDAVLMKLVVSGLFLMVIVGLFFVNSKADNRGPSWSYRGGKSDLFYRGLFNNDGSLRGFVKPVLIVCFLAGLLALWIL